jgi:hypothetical protein
MTNDADVTVAVESLADFEALKDRLADFGFARSRVLHRMRHHSAGTKRNMRALVCRRSRAIDAPSRADL